MCDPGTYSLENSGFCMFCPGGTYTDEAQSSECKVCPAGKYAGVGSTECTDCEVGKYSTAGLTACLDCLAGKVAETPGMSACTACGRGT